jgi:hypothetical protein
MKRDPVRAPRRWLKLRAVADLMSVEHPDPHYRVKYVRRLLRRLERRDGTVYLKQLGAGRGAKLYVSPEGLEQLRPYSPTLFTKLRDDVDDVDGKVTELRRQVNGHGARIRKLEEFKKKTAEYLAAVADL